MIVNGFLVSDALIDSGSQLSLIDSRVYSVIAPNAELTPPARLVSASGHQLNAIGKCTLSVCAGHDQSRSSETEFTVVHNLSHNLVLGWDFLSSNGVNMDCSMERGAAKLKLRIKKPVSVPPRSALCLSVKVDRPLSCDAEYVFVGQQSNDMEICDSLIRPFSDTEIPIYVRNRSDRVITVHRRSVIGYAERVEHFEPCAPEPAERDTAAEVNAVSTDAVSADDGRYVGKSADDILSEFVVGEPLSCAQRDKLASLLRSFPEVFSRGYSDIGAYKGGEVDLELQPGARPQFVRPYPVPWAREEQLRAQLDELQSCGVIETGGPSDWNSPIILVPKGKGSSNAGTREFRIVQDMRSLNKSLVPKTFVFPNIDEFLFSLQGWKIASSLDIKHAFWNLRLSEASSKICAFHALGRTYYPKRMPMGCMQSSYFLHLVMHKVLGDIPGVHIYADDVLLTSPSIEEHFALLHKVLNRLQSAGLKVAPNKCRLFQTRLTYLGHQITPDGITIDPERVQVVDDMQPPKSVREAKRVLGFFSWFRKFIPFFSAVSEPLVVLCNSDKFFWNAELDQCFASLQRAVMSDQVLSYPRKGGEFVLYTDSSTTGSGQVLCQVQDGAERVIAFSGNRYSKAQRHWTIYELEVFSFIQGLKKFYKYLADAEFRWVCDCKSALRILSNRDQINPRLIRWRAFVSQFRYVAEHRRASLMAHVDALSRLHEPNGPQYQPSTVPASGAATPGEETPPAFAGPREGAPLAVEDAAGRAPRTAADAAGSAPRSAAAAAGSAPRPAAGGPDVRVVRPADAQPRGGGKGGTSAASGINKQSDGSSAEEIYGAREVNFTTADFLLQSPLKPDAVSWYQRHDRNCRAIAHRLNHGKWPRFASPVLKRESADRFVMKDGLVYRDGQLVWPVAKRFELMYQHHDVSHHAHGGGAKLSELLSRHVWYPGLRSDCDDYVRSCTRCSQRKSTQSHRPPLLPQRSTYPNQTLVIDVLAMPRGHVHGRSSVLTCVDKFSGYLSYYTLDSGSSDCIVEALNRHFLVFGPPENIESDAGSNLLNNSHVQTLCDHFGVHTRASVGYHHEAVGKVERRHLDMKRRLRAVSDSHGADWEQRLQGVVFSLNNEVCDTVGYSPFFLYFLRHPHCSLSRLSRAPRNQYSDSFVHEHLRLLSSTLQRAQARQAEESKRYKQQYDRRYRVQERVYKPGDRLWVRNFQARSKMDDPWRGPYVVMSNVGRRHVDYMDNRGTVRRTHTKNVKPWKERA